MPTLDEFLASVPSHMLRQNSKYLPKLSIDDRRAILALFKAGVPTPVLAEAFGVHRRTVRTMVTEGARFYRDLRDEYKRMGDQSRYFAMYVSDDHSKKVAAVMNDPGRYARTKLDSRTYQVATNTADTLSPYPNPRAKSKAGEHTIRPTNDNYLERTYRISLECHALPDMIAYPHAFHYFDMYAPIDTQEWWKPDTPDDVRTIPRIETWGYFVLNDDAPILRLDPHRFVAFHQPTSEEVRTSAPIRFFRTSDEAYRHAQAGLWY